MTHSIDAPFPPPATTAGATSPTTTPPVTQSTGTSKTQQTKDAAMGEAKNVGQTAADAGSQVASVATDQAKQVIGETQRQAKDLLDQGRTQVKSQVVSQQQKAGQSLSSLAQELRGLADGTSEGAPGPARDLLQQASTQVENFASMLQNREPAQLLDDVRSFARRKPGLFLLGAAAAGVLAGRLTSGVKAAHSDSSPSNGMSGQSNYVDPTPTYSDYSVTDTYAGTGTSTYPAVGTTTGGAPLPPPPYGTVPPEGSMVPPASPAGWDDPARRPGGVG
ncbi:MAG: hypothetical protein AVDCRST_MAG52-3012 [uncultured Blastococcus sp.]|uniref:Uncharacterized protein n=1 Tax=uncultured Blastococcus sp. TaxID=217144 RepID=A0A6J4J2P0_9ACTN|nr:MAG: hypothetical protein AVDCRST_MAG52-3012 [uncultured Blastococcus sp.]